MDFRHFFIIILSGLLIATFALLYQVSLTGKIVEKFEFDHSFVEGDVVSGDLVIYVDDDPLPLDSSIKARLGDKESEIPLVYLLDNSQFKSSGYVDFYPEVFVSTSIYTEGSLAGGAAITGFTTSSDGSSGPSVSSPSSGGSSGGDGADFGVKTANSYPVDLKVDSSPSTISIRGTRVKGADVISVSLADGSPIDKRLIDLKVEDGEIKATSRYNERVIGFKDTVIRIPLVNFGLVAKKGGELVLSVKSLHDSVLIDSRTYIPFGDKASALPESTPLEINDGLECGDLVCEFNPCSPNIDSTKILLGVIEKKASSVIACSSSCGTQYREVECEKRDFDFERSSENETKVNVLIPGTEEVVASIGLERDKVDIIFDN